MMTKKRLIGMTLWVGLAAVAIWIGFASPAKAQQWQRISIGGGSMKRNVVDLNNDSRADSLSVNTWYKNPGTGSGNWQAIATGWNQDQYDGSYHVGRPDMDKIADAHRVGDINGDGLPDMVVGIYGTDYLGGVDPGDMKDYICAAINPGNEGHWSFHYIGKLPATQDGVETVAIGDMNNDGHIDILAGGECKQLRWYINPGSMTSNWSYQIVGQNFNHSFFDGYADVEGVAIGHFDSDNYLDVSVTTCSPNGMCGGTYILTNPASQTPSGSWTCTTITEGSSALGFPSSGKYSCAETIAMGDIDGDGWNDVVLADRRPYGVDATVGDTRFYWYENPQGSGDWTEHEIDLLSDDALQGRLPSVADVDQDGDQDLINFNQKDGVIYWYENNGDGSSWMKHTIYGASLHENYGVGDVNGDGYPDFISGGYWYQNPVPEPCTAGLLLGGFACLMPLRRRIAGTKSA
ncbi:MAG: VCBS repeat-containing protein [Phycisphaerae bacterium]|nr:VCBS repeat-containing protein [Phycisphaerae bacterium]